MRLTRRVLARNGKEVRPSTGASAPAGWRDLQLERIPLDWGAFLRRLSENGKSPCSEEWNGELDRQAFWRDFPSAFRFQLSEPDQLQFVPASNFQPRRTIADGMLTAIRGRFWFDPSRRQITRLE